MLDKVKGFEKALETVIKSVKHQDYARVVKLHNEYYKPFITGDNIDHLFQRFNPRESEEMFKQRKAITQLCTPAICNAIITPSRKVPTVKPVVDTLGYEPANPEKVKKLSKNLADFHGKKDLLHYLSTTLPDQSAIDPNSFLIITFDNFDNRFKQPDPYPTIVSCIDAWNYEYVNGELEFLTVQKDILYIRRIGNDRKPEYSKGNRFITYVQDYHIEFLQISSESEFLKGLFDPKFGILYDDQLNPVDDIKNTKDTVNNTEVVYYLFASRETVYQVRFFNHNSGGRIPCLPLGFKKDPVTLNRTCVSLIEPAVAYLMKNVKTGSELDLSQALHVFLQKIGYYPKCPGESKDVGCLKGAKTTGGTCSRCNGSGFLYHESAQDIIGLEKPDDPNEIIDLSKLVHYVSLPIDIVKHLAEYQELLEQKALKAVYTSSKFSKPTIASTATEILVNSEDVYDALQPFADHFSFIYTNVVHLIAGYLDISENLTVIYKIPKNFRFEALNELLNTLKIARDGGASDAVLNQINADIAKHIYRDDPDTLDKIRIQELFNPFSGKSESATMSIISSGWCTEFNKILWSEMKSIFNEIESEYVDPSFYKLSYKKQKEIIDKKVKDRIEAIRAEAPAITTGFNDPDEEDTDTDTGSEKQKDPVINDTTGKIPLALQQMALARERAIGVNDQALASQIGKKMKELVADL